jgi:tripartite-type tricarboxylate transporter receptor subunit TctC
MTILIQRLFKSGVACRALAVCAVVSVQFLSAAAAQNFPDKPIRVVVGPGSDLLPRVIGQRLAPVWGQQLVVDQRPGSGGIIAQDIVAKTAPDGYTWLLSTAAFVINAILHPELSSSLEKDFEPVTLLATATYLLLVDPATPAKSVSELIQLARANPAQINYASAGVGTPPHLAGEMFKSMARINIVHVPYKSAAAAMTDLLGGHVQMSFQFAPTALPYFKSGKLRALAVTSARRSLIAPDLPTIAESGLPGYEVIGWNAIHVPARTPKRVVAKINRDVRAVLDLPDVRERMLAAGLELSGNSPEEFAAFVKTDFPHWRKLVEQSGTRVE